jgi:hypothetical protein
MQYQFLMGSIEKKAPLSRGAAEDFTQVLRAA